MAERQAARDAKDFATSDRIRDELAAEGIELRRYAHRPYLAPPLTDRTQQESPCGTVGLVQPGR